MATMHTIKAAARRVGATVSRTDDRVIALAPNGSSWNCEPGLHSLVADWTHDNAWRAEALDDLAERVAAGVAPCECEDCTPEPRPDA